MTGHMEGYFFLRCNNVEDVIFILQENEYSMRGRPVILCKWSSSFDFQKEILRKVPIRLKLYNLPLEC